LRGYYTSFDPTLKKFSMGVHTSASTTKLGTIAKLTAFPWLKGGYGDAESFWYSWATFGAAMLILFAAFLTRVDRHEGAKIKKILKY
jgi:hypothetical protein